MHALDGGIVEDPTTLEGVQECVSFAQELFHGTQQVTDLGFTSKRSKGCARSHVVYVLGEGDLVFNIAALKCVPKDAAEPHTARLIAYAASHDQEVAIVLCAEAAEGLGASQSRWRSTARETR